jgi:hypothetical protein
MAYNVLVLIVETRAFTQRIRSLISDDEYRELQLGLVAAPEAGAVIRGSGGLRKIRWSASGRGKSGGIRVIYFFHRAADRMLLLFAFAKNERSDLTAAQVAMLRTVIEQEYPKT